MAGINMVSLRLHPGKKSANCKTAEDAYKWLNLNTFESFSVHVHCAEGKHHVSDFKDTDDFLKWIRVI